MRGGLLALLLALSPLSAPAQEGLSMGQLQSPVLTIDVERLLAETLYGRRLAEDLRERSEALAAENEALRLELVAEERRLTEQRPTMEVDDFRAAAEEFDARVQGIRAEQDAKESALERAVDDGRQAFLNAATPVLARLMIESGAAVMLERRDVFLSAGVIDVTDEAIAAIDAQIGDGTGVAPAGRPNPMEAAPDGPVLDPPATVDPALEPAVDRGAGPALPEQAPGSEGSGD